MDIFSKLRIWAPRAAAAFIMLQTLYFKFSGAEESVYIFSVVGMEPWGRYGIGFFELVASVLLFIRPISWLGAGIGLGLMAGAIGMHLTILGIEVHNDGGQLFYYALIVAVACIFVLWEERENLLKFIKVVFMRK